jgi:hypothetical protein
MLCNVTKKCVSGAIGETSGVVCLPVRAVYRQLCMFSLYLFIIIHFFIFYLFILSFLRQGPTT